VTTTDWIELVTAIVTVGGGGSVAVAKLTRIAVAAETLAEKIEALAEQVKTITGQVQDHEKRLNKGGLLQLDVREVRDRQFPAREGLV
jgi:outer membrane murein-binding lipoprotein Lpp